MYVEVVGHTPEARHWQLAVLFLAIGLCVGTSDSLGLPVPDHPVPLCAVEQVLLIVGHPEDTVAQQSQQQDANGVGGEHCTGW